MFQGEMLHYALFQGMHGVFVPIRRKGTNRSDDRLRRQTLKNTIRAKTQHAILNTRPSSIRHRFKNTMFHATVNAILPLCQAETNVEFLHFDVCFLSSTYSSLNAT